MTRNERKRTENGASLRRETKTAGFPAQVVERSLGAAGFEKAVSFRRLCQCLIQSESLAARLHVRPAGSAGGDEAVASLVEGRTRDRGAVADATAAGRKSPDAAADAARCLSPPAKGMQKRGKSIRKKAVQPAPEKTGFES